MLVKARVQQLQEQQHLQQQMQQRRARQVQKIASCCSFMFRHLICLLQISKSCDSLPLAKVAEASQALPSAIAGMRQSVLVSGRTQWGWVHACCTNECGEGHIGQSSCKSSMQSCLNWIDFTSSKLQVHSSMWFAANAQDAFVAASPPHLHGIWDASAGLIEQFWVQMIQMHQCCRP